MGGRPVVRDGDTHHGTTPASSGGIGDNCIADVGGEPSGHVFIKFREALIADVQFGDLRMQFLGAGEVTVAHVLAQFFGHGHGFR